MAKESMKAREVKRAKLVENTQRNVQSLKQKAILLVFRSYPVTLILFAFITAA